MVFKILIAFVKTLNRSPCLLYVNPLIVELDCPELVFLANKRYFSLIRTVREIAVGHVL